jgi:chromosome partitioning protein
LRVPHAVRPRTFRFLPFRRRGDNNGHNGNGHVTTASVAPSLARLPGVTVYAVANQKGGVGKTTTAVNVAAAIAETGRRVLLVDVDPQANATVALGVRRDISPNLYEVLSGTADPEAALHVTEFDGLELMPAGIGLAGANVELPRLAGSENRLRQMLEPVLGRYDLVLLDCPPSLGPLTVNALVAADRLIVPVQTEYFALEGLAQMLDSIRLIQRELNPDLTVAGMLLTMHDPRTRLARDVEREVRDHFPELVFETVIPRNVRISEAPSYGKPVTLHDPESPGAGAYVALAKEVAARG